MQICRDNKLAKNNRQLFSTHIVPDKLDAQTILDTISTNRQDVY